MKKLIFGGAAIAVVCAVTAQVLPDIRRYLRIRCM
jgi:hypothetical protein